MFGKIPALDIECGVFQQLSSTADKIFLMLKTFPEVVLGGVHVRKNVITYTC